MSKSGQFSSDTVGVQYEVNKSCNTTQLHAIIKLVFRYICLYQETIGAKC